MTQQRDCDWKIRYQLRGAHYHCRLFSRYRNNATWESIGELVVRENEWSSFVNAFGNAAFEEASA